MSLSRKSVSSAENHKLHEMMMDLTENSQSHAVGAIKSHNIKTAKYSHTVAELVLRQQAGGRWAQTVFLQDSV